jgi:hypothetical protein
MIRLREGTRNRTCLPKKSVPKQAERRFLLAIRPRGSAAEAPPWEIIKPKHWK